MHEIEDRAAGAVRASGPEVGLEFDEQYFANYWPGIQPYRRDDYWLGFFRGIAERISTDLQPKSVLDAGCALGILVEALRDLGIDAWGVDISEWAIANAHESVRDYCWQGSLTEPLPRHFDLVACFEVLEHMSVAEAEAALDNICGASDRVVFSSTPADFGEPTHVNVRATEDWAALFARRGFLRNLDIDASFVAPWAAVYDRSSDPVPEVVRRYERSLQRLREEAFEVRQQIIRQEQRFREIAHGDMADQKGLIDQRRQLEEDLLAAHDVLVGQEAKLGDALGRIEELEAELVAHEEAAERLELITGSGSWKAATLLQRCKAVVRGRP